MVGHLSCGSGSAAGTAGLACMLVLMLVRGWCIVYDQAWHAATCACTVRAYVWSPAMPTTTWLGCCGCMIWGLIVEQTCAVRCCGGWQAAAVGALLPLPGCSVAVEVKCGLIGCVHRYTILVWQFMCLCA